MLAVAVSIFLLGSFSWNGEAVECYKCRGVEDICGAHKLKETEKVTCGGSCFVKKGPKGQIITRDCNPFQENPGCTEDDNRDITCHCNVDECNSDSPLGISLPLLALAILLQQLM